MRMWVPPAKRDASGIAAAGLGRVPFLFDWADAMPVTDDGEVARVGKTSVREEDEPPSLQLAVAVLHGLFYLVMAVICWAFVSQGVAEFRDRNRPVVWGTFTESSTTCESRRWGQSCFHTGRWVSDDGGIVKTGISLDGFVARGGSVRAGYKAGGASNDDENNIVHTAPYSGPQYWLNWAIGAVVAGFAVYKRHRWNREDERDSRLNLTDPVD
jgi:hypothetical protein